MYYYMISNYDISDILRALALTAKQIYGSCAEITSSLVVNARPEPMKRIPRRCRGQYGRTNFFL